MSSAESPMLNATRYQHNHGSIASFAEDVIGPTGNTSRNTSKRAFVTTPPSGYYPHTTWPSKSSKMPNPVEGTGGSSAKSPPAPRHFSRADEVDPVVMQQETDTEKKLPNIRRIRRTRKRENQVPRMTTLEREAYRVADELRNDTLATAEKMLWKFSVIQKLENQLRLEKAAASRASAQATASSQAVSAATLAFERARFVVDIMIANSENFVARGWEVDHDMRDREYEARMAEFAAANEMEAARSQEAEAQSSAIDCADRVATTSRMLERARGTHAEVKREMLSLKRRATCAEAYALSATKAVAVGRCWAESANAVGRRGGMNNLLAARHLVERVGAFDGDEVAPRAKRARR